MTRNLPSITIRELIEAGVHFGHRTMRWNPKMSSYLYGTRDGIHIIDLQQTLPLLNQALEKIYDVAKAHGRILFVGTKTQASEIVAEEAKRCGQYYINHRWLGGTMTNWATIHRSIKKLQDLEKLLADQSSENEEQGKFTKKERLDISRKIEKLEKALGGIREMGGIPDILFVIDTNMEDLAVKEARTLGIPVVAILDSNSNPDDITYPIPGNDDATRALKLYCRLVADTILYGMQESLVNSGVDLGESSDLSNILQLNTRDKSAKDTKKKPAEEKSEKKDEAAKPVAKKITKTETTKPAKSKAATTEE